MGSRCARLSEQGIILQLVAFVLLDCIVVLGGDLRVRRLLLSGEENSVGIRGVEGDMGAFGRLKGDVVGLGTA
jgi:hypothetical protein